MSLYLLHRVQLLQPDDYRIRRMFAALFQQESATDSAFAAPLINTTYFHPFPCRSKRLHFPINLSVTAESCVLEDSVRKSDITERTKTHLQNVWKK
ncbi:hypothetical protein TNCT_481781 [Trichonephila clavata]|uniref:Uncharacterized protein n=1 Tax=Trichonephila clavata TaxID=2740835 RepID=A0A8X6KX87_TRICU|nr:hypothetical protein TNCT_481781 [Trichonephila clavata]